MYVDSIWFCDYIIIVESVALVKLIYVKGVTTLVPWDYAKVIIVWNVKWITCTPAFVDFYFPRSLPQELSCYFLIKVWFICCLVAYLIFYVNGGMFSHLSLSHSFCCRGRSELCSASSSKACREKLRRDRLNDKYSLVLSYLYLCVYFFSLARRYRHFLFGWLLGFWSWALSWSLEDLLRQIRLLFWLMQSEWWLSYEVKLRSWRTQIQVFKRRSKNWRSFCIHSFFFLFMLRMKGYDFGVPCAIW